MFTISIHCLKVIVIISDYKFKKDEIFKRMKSSTFAQLVSFVYYSYVELWFSEMKLCSYFLVVFEDIEIK